MQRRTLHRIATSATATVVALFATASLAAVPTSSAERFAKGPPSQAAAGSDEQLAATALTHTRALVDAYGRCGEVSFDEPCAQLDDLFDFERLTQAPLAGHAAQLSPSQRKRFSRAFGSVVRRAARQSGKDLGKGSPQLTFLGRTAQGAKSEVHVVRPEEDVDLHVAFVWQTGAKRWRVVDVELDGASMVQDYHNQFGRVLKKEGAEGLVKKIEARSKSAAAAGQSAEP